MKDMDWIVRLLVDLHSFCETNGFDSLSNRLADAIEEAAPMFRGARPDGDGARDRARSGHILQGQAAHPQDGPPKPRTAGRPRLVAVNVIET
jgi:hypothetical protein